MHYQEQNGLHVLPDLQLNHFAEACGEFRRGLSDCEAEMGALLGAFIVIIIV